MNFRLLLALPFFLITIYSHAQKENSGTCKFSVFSKFREALSLEVFYFSADNKRIRSTSGYPHVNACRHGREDSIKTVAFWSTGYFLQVLKIDDAITRDTVFLPQLANQAINKIEGLVFDAAGKLNVNESKIAVSEYIKFIHREKAFTFRITVSDKNPEQIARANAFYRELLKTDQGLKLKLSVEQSSDPDVSQGFYLKAFVIR